MDGSGGKSDQLSVEEIRQMQLNFSIEANEWLDTCERYLLNCNNHLSEEELADLKRILHGLKGSSTVSGLIDFGKTVHEMESQVLLLKNGRELVDRLLSDIDQLRSMLAQL